MIRQRGSGAAAYKQQADRERERQTDRQTDRETDRQTDRQRADLPKVPDLPTWHPFFSRTIYTFKSVNWKFSPSSTTFLHARR